MRSIRKITAAALAAICAISAAFPASAGWEKKDGKDYYLRSDGSYAVKSTVINGIRWSFDSDGVCLGKYTGWVSSKGCRFYYLDGEKQTGWVHVEASKPGKKGAWYYIDSEKGRLTGEQEIDGNTFDLGKNGKWNEIAPKKEIKGKERTLWSVLSCASSRKLDEKCYGGAYVLDGMAIILSVDGKAEKEIARRYPGVGGIIYKKAEYSMYEMNAIRDELKDRTDLWTSSWIDEMRNRLILGASDEERPALEEYVNKLPNKGCIEIVSDNGEFFDD